MHRGFLAVFWLCAGLWSGCQGIHRVHERGVYTIEWFPDLTPLRSFEVIGKVDVPKKNFAPGEIPVAVVRGYDDFEVDLLVVQSSTGKVLLSKAIQTGRGRGAFQPLHLPTPGDYELRLLRRGVIYDRYHFTVLPATVSN